MSRLIVCALALIATTVYCQHTHASNWPNDPTANIQLSNIAQSVSSAISVQDGGGGVITAWSPFSTPGDVYVQRVNADGVLLWTSGGVLVASNSGNVQRLEAVVPDGSGGAIMIWQDDRNGIDEYYGQRVNANGNLLWQSNGRRLLPGPFPVVACGASTTIVRSATGGEVWTEPTHPATEHMHGVSLVGDSGGVCGEGGLIMHTINGGATWLTQASGTGGDLFGIDFFDSSQGIAVGEGGTVTRWTGASWQLQAQPVADALHDVDHTSSLGAIAVGDAGTIIRTINGGVNWTIDTSSTTEALRSIAYASSNVAVAVGDAGTIRRTEIGGGLWNSQVSGTAQALHGVDFSDANTATAVGAGGTIIRSIDAGQTWSSVSSPTSDDLLSVSFVDASCGVGVGENGSAILTIDGGATWSAVPTGVSAALRGVAMSRVSSNRRDLQAVSDDAGGAIVVFEDDRSGDFDIFAQRIDANGNRLWFDDLVLDDSSGDQLDATIARDGLGGAFFGWEDWSGADIDIYGHGVNADGSFKSGGRFATCTATGNQDNVVAAYDGQLGVVYAWHDSRNGAAAYAQRVSGLAQGLWTTNGVPVVDVTASVAAISIISDEVLGVIVGWRDTRNSSESEVYAQRLLLNGTPAWTANGVQVSESASHPLTISWVADGSGGATAFWTDFRTGAASVYANSVDEFGAAGSVFDTPVSVGLLNRFDVSAVSNGLDGAIATFSAFEPPLGGGDAHVYVQNLDRHGYLGDPSPAITSVVDVPNDQGGVATVNWAPSYMDVFPETVIENYSVWRRNEQSPVSPHAHAAAVAGGVEPSLAQRMAQGGWVFVDMVSAFYLNEYGYDAATYGDSTGSGTPLTGYQIIAHTNDQFVFWVSDAATGYSIDNLSPAAPLSLAAVLQGNDIGLSWVPGGSEPDLKEYAVYHSQTPGVIPGPSTLLFTTTNTFGTHVSPFGGPHYYVVTAIDLQDNSSPPSNEATVEVVTAIPDGMPPPARFTVLPAFPNPLNESATIRFGVPQGGTALVNVFDVAGRRVSSSSIVTPKAGWYEHAFTARDAKGRALPSGVYFYRVQAAGNVETIKLIVTR